MKKKDRSIVFKGGSGTYSATGYRSASSSVSGGRGSSGGSGSAHVEMSRKNLINQSRTFMRNNSLYKGMIERAVGYIVGNGFGLQIKTPSKSFNNQAEQLWKKYWHRPEHRKLLAGRRVERMICRELLVCGDTGINKINTGDIQLIEAEQIIGKSLNSDGVETDQYGVPSGYWVAPYGRGGRAVSSKSEKKPLKDFLFIADPERPSGIRAVPPCQSAFPMLHRINDVCDSEAIAWQLLARLAVAITSEGGEEKGYDNSTEDPNATTTEAATRMTELDYALIFHGEPGDEIKGIERNIPGKNFTESLTMFLRLLGLPLGIPLEVILLDWTKSNYSQSRAVLEQAYQAFLGWQMLLEEQSYTPVLEWQINRWIKAKLLKPTQWIKDNGVLPMWIKPTFPWIDQLKETQAHGAQVDRGFTTHGLVCKSKGMEREDVVAARVAEVRDAITQAQQIENDTTVKVPWQIFAGLEAKPSAPAPTEPDDNDGNPPKDKDKDIKDAK